MCVYLNKIALAICAVMVLFIQLVRGERRPVYIFVWGGVLLSSVLVGNQGTRQKCIDCMSSNIVSCKSVPMW